MGGDPKESWEEYAEKMPVGGTVEGTGEVITAAEALTESTPETK